MEAIILAGGFGTRLRSVVPDLPKPMAPVAGRPFLETLLNALARRGIRRAVLSLGYLSEKIIQHFGDTFAGIELAYVVEDSPLGTGGAIRLAMDQVANDHAYIFNGDTFLDLDLSSVEALWTAHHRPIIVGRNVADTTRYGRLLAEQGRVTGFAEKGISGPGLINAGCYVFGKDQLNQFVAGTAFSIETDFLMPEVQKAPLDLFVSDGLFIDIGIPEDYQLAQTLLSDFAVSA